MNILEMHIEVAQATQNIAANVRRKLQMEEIDWLLNKNQERFIQSKVKPRKDGSGGFQIDQVDTDSIRTLLATASNTAQRTDLNEYAYQLPADYSYLISDDSKNLLLCTTVVPDPATIIDAVLILPLKSTKSSAKFFETIVINLGSNSYSLNALTIAYQLTYIGLNSKEEVYVVRDAMLWYMRNTLKLNVYWESYRNLYRPNSFLFVNMANSGSIVVDGTSVAGVLNNISYTGYTTAEGQWYPNRLTPSDKISTILRTPFVKPSVHTSVSKLSGNELIVYGDVSYIVTGVRVDYVKKARRLNLLLGQNCELPEEFHQAVCDLTVEYFKAMTVDPSWEMKLKDNITRSTI